MMRGVLFKVSMRGFAISTKESSTRRVALVSKWEFVRYT